MPAQQLPPDIRLLARAVDAVLVPHGFAPAQVGLDDRRGQLTWCAGAADLARRSPWLPSSQEPVDGRGTSCTDVVVDVARAGAGWCISGVRLEGDDLARLLADAGPVEAAQAAGLVGTPAADSLVLLPSLLDRLVDAPGDPS